MPYREKVKDKTYILTCRDLHNEGYYMIQSYIFTYVNAENLDEAVKKLQVIEIRLGNYTISVLDRCLRKTVLLPPTPPDWYKASEVQWEKLLNPQLLWEVVELRSAFIGDLTFFEGKRKKVKIKR